MIHTRRFCDNCSRQFVHERTFRNDPTLCPVCGSQDIRVVRYHPRMAGLDYDPQGAPESTNRPLEGSVQPPPTPLELKS